LCVSALLNTPPERPFDMAARFALVKVTFEFLAGLLLFRAYSALHGRELRWVTGSTIAVAVMLLVALHSKALPPVVQDPLAVLMAAMLILCLALGGGAGGLLESRAAVFLGEASYSIYMVHGLVMLEYFQLIERHAVATEASLAAGLLRVALVVAIVIVLGVVLYRFVEVPSRRAVRALAD
jgi:peptidoglycan/LPS O-acetylase OafA/YrhL